MDQIIKLLADPLFVSQLLIGTLIVFFAAYIRFRTPPSVRSETTALRFYIFAITYCLLALFLYYMLAISPGIGLALLEALGVPTKNLDPFSKLLERLPPPFVALALIQIAPEA